MLKSSLTTTLILSLCFRVFAQGLEKNQSLSSILQSLENTYQVTFTYADDAVAGQFITSAPKPASLLAWLEHLESVTNLRFQRINEKFIAITAVTEICGRLLDAETGEPVAYATVSGKSLGMVSDEQGFFRTGQPGELKDSLVISHIAYEPRRLSLTEVLNDSCLTIRIEPRFTKLPEIMVRNYLVTGISKNKNGAFVIDPQEQQILPGLTEPDVLFTIQAFPGVESAAESVADINIRGGTNDQNLVLWDGIRMYQTGHFFGLISAFNPYITRRVVFIKNGTSAAYGEGVSGTIRMESAVADNVKGFGGGAGTNLIHSDVNLHVPLTSKMNVSVAARRSTTDWITSNTYQKYFRRAFQNTELDRNAFGNARAVDDRFYFYDWHAKVNYALSDRDQLRLSALRIYNRLEYVEQASSNGVTTTRASNLEQKSLATGMFYSRLWNKKLKTSLNGYVSAYKLQAANQDISNNQELKQENEVMDIRMESTMQMILSPNLDLHAGYIYDQIGVGDLEEVSNPSFRRFTRRVLNAQILFAETNFTSHSQKTFLRTGIRVSHYPQIGHPLILEPRISFNQQLADHLNMEFLAEMKNQTMSQIIDLQNDFLGVEKRRWTLANGEDIPLIRSQQVSMGLHYNQKPLLASLEAYYKVVNGIISSGQAFQNQFEFIRSTGSYTVRGLELLIRKAFNPLSVWVSYSLARNDYTFEELYSDPFPNNLDIRHHVFLGSSYKAGPFESSLGFSWHSGRPYTSLVAGQPVMNGLINYQAPNSSRLGSYLRVDFSSTYTFPLGKAASGRVGISLWNLTNHQNVINRFYRLEGADASPVQHDWQALEFTPNLVLRVMF